MLFRGFIIKNNPPAEDFSENKSLKQYITQRSKHLSRATGILPVIFLHTASPGRTYWLLWSLEQLQQFQHCDRLPSVIRYR